ncbi:MAG TPA: DUF2470 domain-containing protein [Mycobacteriales bacterium]|nr:DUF2470 domain-containing protein [Mycobacteriales bacterium]
MPPTMPGHPAPPDAAVLARTAVACARVGTLTTYPRSPAQSPYVTTVAVSGQDDGSAVAYVEGGGLAAQLLLARPLATLQVAPAACEPVTLLGAARRLPGRDARGRLAFRVEAGAVRLGARRQLSLDAGDYVQAAPDPLGRHAPEVLDHLNRGHRGALAACLRALGHEAETAEATALDQHGLSVVAVSASGVDTVRLAFPEPVTRLEDLAPGPGAVLLCRCACRAEPDHH